MAKTRVLLVDDQRLFVNSLHIVLESRTDDIEVVGVAYNGRDGVRMAVEQRPDVVLLDVRMPVMDGVQAAGELATKVPSARVIMLTTYDDDDYVRDSLKHGAAGYLLKSLPPTQLIASIRVAMSGTIQISPEAVATVLADDAQQLVNSRDAAAVPAELAAQVDTLTQREREVLALLTKAYDNRQIAAALSIADQTVKNHVHAIYDKLGVSNRMQLIQRLNRIG